MKKEQKITVYFEDDRRLWGAQIDDGLTFTGDTPEEAFEAATEYLTEKEADEALRKSLQDEAVYQAQCKLLDELANRAVAVSIYGLSNYVERECGYVRRKPKLTLALVEGWLKEQKIRL